MENINPFVSPLTGIDPEVQKKKAKAAVIFGTVILVGTVLSVILRTINSWFDPGIAPGGSYYSFYQELVLNSGYIAGYLTLAIPNILLSIYLLAGYKKNPAHGLFKASLILLVSNCIFGIFACTIALIAEIDSLSPPEIIANQLLFTLDYFTGLIFAVILCIVVFGKFRNYKLGRVIQIISLVLDVIFCVCNIIFNIYGGNPIEPEWLIGIVVNIAMLAVKIAFWFVCIDKDTYASIPVKRLPAPQPVYAPPFMQQTPVQPPVQPVAPPVYQPPVQPVTPPVYQQPVRPVAPPVYNPPVKPVIQDDEAAKLTKLRKLLADGLISHEDYEKKKNEILEKI